MAKKKKGTAQRSPAEPDKVMVQQDENIITIPGRMPHWWELWRDTKTSELRSYYCYNTTLPLLRNKKSKPAKKAEADPPPVRKKAGKSDALAGFDDIDSATELDDSQFVEDGFVDVTQRWLMTDRSLTRRLEMGQDVPPWWTAPQEKAA